MKPIPTTTIAAATTLTPAAIEPNHLGTGAENEKINTHEIKDQAIHSPAEKGANF